MKPGVVCLLAAVALGQTTFRSDVRLINVSAVVRDSSGKLVDNLGQGDFEILEDGVPQKLAFFARSNDVPLNLGLVVDISGSQAAFVRAHQHDLKAFLDRALSQRDRAFLLCFASHPRLITQYTSSGKQLIDALEGYMGTNDKLNYPLLGPPEIRSGSAFYDAVYHASNQMFQNVERGRKALVIFSDGEDNTSAHNMLETIELAQTNDVVLFCVRYTETRGGRWTARNKYGRGVMERVAFETGGADFDASEKDVSAHFRDIGEHLRSSYELAYHSSNPPDDRTFHKIAIRVKQAGYTVRAKTGYFAK
jgi:Ca-activated chloride channel family protein